MTKEELVIYIKELEVEDELKNQLLSIVESKTEINAELLQAIADIIDMSADLCLQEAEIQTKQSQILDDLVSAFNKEENKEKIGLINLLKKTNSNKKATENTEKVEYIGSSNTAKANPNQEALEMEKARQAIQAATK